MLNEATERIRILEKQGLSNKVVKQWKNGNACFSEMTIFLGKKAGINIVFDEMPQLNALKKFLKKNGILLYIMVFISM